MKPPLKAPKSAAKRRSTRQKERERKRFQSEQTRDKVKYDSPSPHPCTRGDLCMLTPPPFNLSFGSELNSEVLLFMEQFDSSTTATSSTPLGRPQLATSHSSTTATFSTPLGRPQLATSHSSTTATSSTPLGRPQLVTSHSSTTATSSTPLGRPQLVTSHSTNQVTLNNASNKTPLFDISNCSANLSKSQTRSRTASFLTTPTRSPSNNLCLSTWGIPGHVLDQYALRGIKTMFPWQAECLALPGVLEGSNLVYSAPTSAGKTLVAELLALKCALESKKKVIFVLPFVSIAHEKSNYLKQVLQPSGVKVGGFMGNQAPAGGFALVDIAICTIEKANSLVNRLLEDGLTHELGLVVVDELHMVGDPYRGYLLELLLTKLMYVSRKDQVGAANDQQDNSSTIQLVGMSATLPNLDMLANWLRAQLYRTDFRPVPLQEMVKVGPTLYDTDFNSLKVYDQSESLPGDEDDVLLICRETVSNGHSVLIFCPTKSWCENLALTLGEAKIVPAQTDSSKLVDVCEQLRRTQVGLDPSLGRSIPNAVAFHHAGLTMEEREIVEGAYRQSLLKVLVATSTLSSGVNLPARLVIIRTPYFQRSLLDVLVYKQMVGRAGRKGVDQSGESILICKASERSKIVGLLKSAPKPVTSCLSSSLQSSANSKSTNHSTAMKRALLEVISSGTAASLSEIQSYTSCTLLYAESSMASPTENKTPPTKNKAPPTKNKTPPIENKLQVVVQSTLDHLLQNEFISSRSQDDKESTYYATQLGMATVGSSLSPDEALIVFGDLVKARRNFVLENELHIIYLVTPVYVQNQWPTIDWYKYLCLWEGLSPAMKHVADILGVRESFLAQAIQGRLPERTVSQRESLRIHRRFYTALALHDLVHEVPIIYVAKRYGATKGLLQTLQGAASTFSGMVTVFCSRLGWKNLELLLSQFQSRLSFGVERELCDLVRVSLLNGFRARVLYNAGLHSLPALATANPVLIESCLRSAVPFKTHKKQEAREGMTWCAKLRRGLSEEQAAREIVSEAQKIISDELKLPISTWSKQNGDHNKMSLKQSIKLPGVQSNPRKSRPSPTLGENVHETNTKKLCVDQLNNDVISEKQVCESDHMTTFNLNDDTDKLVQPRLDDVRTQFDDITKSSSPPSTTACQVKEQVEFIEDSFISFSPILSNEPLASPQTEGYSREDLSQRASPETLLTVPDSLTMDMSLSFSFNTFEMIDAVCQAEGSSTSLFQSLESKTPTHTPCRKDHCRVIAESPVDKSISEPQQTHNDIQSQPRTSVFKTPNKLTTTSFTSTPLCLRELSSLCSSQLSQSGVTIIDVTSNKTLFETFVSESLEQSSLSFAVAMAPTDGSNGIGCTIVPAKAVRGIPLPDGREQVVGVAFCWGELDVYYVSLCKSIESVSLAQRTQAIKNIFTKSIPGQKIISYDLKKNVKSLALTCGLLPQRQTLDPKVGDWMLNPDLREKTIHRMVLQYLPEQPALADDEGFNEVPLSNLATHARDPQIQSSAESVLAFLLTSKMEPLLENEGLYRSFIDIEMPSLLVLTKLELNGIGFSPDECTRLKDILQRRISELEKDAYTLANHTFSLTSPEDVAQVVFVELRLPSGTEQVVGKAQKTLGANTRRTKKRVTNLSTAKNVLEKITSLHPLPGIVLEWRRMSSTVSKMVFPLFKSAVTLENSSRIHPSVQFHTATGRVTVSDPSLQMVPKEFDIGTKLSSSLIHSSTLLSDSQCLELCQTTTDRSGDEPLPSSVCMRDVFVPFRGGVFLAADYSQLELRILAHMSGDEKLTRFLNQDGDVFRMIAGEWLGLLPDEVGEKQRQETKQLCYGMLYGIGAKALGDQLGVSDNDASQFMESFKMKYPTMKKFINTTVQECKENGYICTLLKRKRYLPGIHSTNVHARSHAERQAVNSTIQGSAADLVKTAMVKIDQQLQQLFPNNTVLTQTTDRGNSLTGAYFVLQLHDELLYEVSENELPQVARIVREGMENAMNLSVRFPVKIQVGHAWGRLEPYNDNS